MLTPSEMEQIADDAILGRKQRLSGAEAEAFRQKVEMEMKRAKEQGLVLDIPREFEIDLDD